jgi:uncharacterized membrane protein
MKKFLQFIKTTIIGGLVVIVPLAILVYAIGEIFVALIEVTTPLTAWMPFGPVVNALLATFTAVAVLVAFFFAAGLVFNTLWGNAVRNWMDEKIFSRIPMYSALKGITQRFAGIEHAGFPVVEIDLYGSECRVLGVAVEQLPDDRQAVYIPSSPVATVGQMIIVPSGSVKEIDAPLTDMFGAVSQMGIETSKLYKKISQP